MLLAINNMMYTIIFSLYLFLRMPIVLETCGHTIELKRTLVQWGKLGNIVSATSMFLNLLGNI